MFDFPLAFLLVGTAFSAAFLGFALVLAFAHSGPGRDAGDRPAGGIENSGIVFFLDGTELVDASAEAMQILQSGSDGTAGGLGRVMQALTPRFPDLQLSLKDLGDVGTLTLMSRQDEAGQTAPMALVATRQGGLTRIQLHDGTRENRSLSVDPVTWRLLNEELDILRKVTLRMVGPAWVEDDGGEAIWANPAYLALFDQHKGAEHNLPWPLPSLFNPTRARLGSGSDGSAPERASITVAGTPHWFELHEAATPSGGRVRFAEPIDSLHRAEVSLRDFVQTLSKTFSQLPIGLAVFDRNRSLHMFNPALGQLTGLSFEFLAGRPRLSAVLDALRELNRLPEPKNYQNWRRELIEMERAAASGGYEDVWNLPDGLSFRVTGRPHPDGAIALMIEDITPEIQRSQRYHKDLALGLSVIDAIPDPVAVFNSAGGLVMENTAFAAFGPKLAQIGDDGHTAPDLDRSDRALEVLHVRDVVERLGGRAAPSPFWKQLQEFVLTIGDREAWKAQVRLADGRLFDCSVQPLPGSATMVFFRAAAVAAPKMHLAEADAARLQA